jgi:hypothetical protein
MRLLNHDCNEWTRIFSGEVSPLVRGDGYKEVMDYCQPGKLMPPGAET